MQVCPTFSDALKPVILGRIRAMDPSKVGSRAGPKIRFAATGTRKEPARQALHSVSPAGVLVLLSTTCRVSPGCHRLRAKPRVSRDTVGTQLITRCTGRVLNTVPRLLWVVISNQPVRTIKRAATERMAPDSEGTTTGATIVVDGELITGTEARNVLPYRSDLQRPVLGKVGKTNGLYDNSGVLICCTFCDLLLLLSLASKKEETRSPDWYVANGTKEGVRCSMTMGSQSSFEEKRR